MAANRKVLSLPWRTVWITGAGRGIGAALATRLCQLGATVYGSARNRAELEQLADALVDSPGQLIPAPLDIREPEQIQALLKTWQREQRFPELVVLNAGTHDPFPAQQFSAERCRALLAINLQGTLNCLDSVLARYIRQNSGQIAVMASVAGYRGLPTAAAYGAGKAALINLCEALYLDLAGSGVKLQLINPGFVRTPLTDKNTFHMPALLEPEQAAEAILNGLLSERFEISFPRRFVFSLKLLRMLPYCWYFKLVQRITGAGSRK